MRERFPGTDREAVLEWRFSVDAHHRSLYLPRSPLPRVAGFGRLHVRIFRAATGAVDGPGGAPFRRESATIAELFLCTFPGVLTFTLPIAVLVGVLIGLGRMSADSELIAMNAVGMGLRRLLVPVGRIALFGAWR